MDDLELIKSAISGDEESRRAISELVEPIIAYQTTKFCKRFCQDNRFYYQCSLLKNPWAAPNKDVTFCEWGNASYGWMLEYLVNDNRLRKFQAKNEATLKGYLFTIANSLPIYEHWKNWRFGRRIHVPTFVQNIDPFASKVFWALCSNQELPTIAASLKLTEDVVGGLVDKIVIVLTQRNKLHLLNQPKNVSLQSGNKSADADSDEYIGMEITDDKCLPEQKVLDIQMRKIFSQLSPVEQFVIEQFVFDEVKAKEVLDALIMLDISLKINVSPKDMNIQHVYYFYRQTLNKLKKLLDEKADDEKADDEKADDEKADDEKADDEKADDDDNSN